MQTADLGVSAVCGLRSPVQVYLTGFERYSLLSGQDHQIPALVDSLYAAFALIAARGPPDVTARQHVALPVAVEQLGGAPGSELFEPLREPVEQRRHDDLAADVLARGD